eukprot:TRINITY_DN1826_c0_g1_i3.p1 TRINITY_DN1826_c0_g1~~TRINITY_DN1826_c0_g1_i3.p1  ORF type:complete len:932 (+),score=309.95 TRINITY_DN1826_c0_g1_i3:251-2797(+)
MDSCKVWQWLDGRLAGGGCWIGECYSSPFANSTWVGGNKTAAAVFPPTTKAYNDSAWEVVDAPHDFLINATYSPDAPPDQAFIPRSNGWYRKHFNIPAGWKGRSIWVYFEGVFQQTVTYLNGYTLGGHASGYTSYHYRLDNVSSIVYGGENVLAIFVDGQVGTGWWYEGAGIYRHVQLVAADMVHVDVDGLSAPPEVQDAVQQAVGAEGRAVKMAAVTIPASAWVVNDGAASTSAEVTFTLLDGTTGQQVATATVPAQGVGAGAGLFFNATLAVGAAQLWEITNPHLYTLATVVTVGGAAVDATNTTLGVRSINYTADAGYFMNGEHFKIRGFCDHNNFAVVGMAVPDRVKLFAAQTLRSIGGNGRRMSHNPPEPVMLDIYDRLGVVVMDENRQFGNDPLFVMNMGAMVKRDRNHPSIVIWSYCNENGCGGNATAGAPFRDITYLYDGTRPTLGNNERNPNVNRYMDVQGFSHRTREVFEQYHEQFPDKPTFASECCSCESMRGEDVSNSSAGGPGVLEEFNADCVAAQTNDSNGLPFMSGTMVWTLFDYFGESHGWPHITSMYGQLDVAGFRKAASHWYETWWLAGVSTPDKPPLGPKYTCHIVEHWTAVGGPSRTIHAYTNAPTVELLVNGASAGNRTVASLKYGEWDSVAYAAGNLEARAYDSAGNTVATCTVVTGGAPVAVVLKVDAPSTVSGTGGVLYADGQDVALLRAEIQDKDGNVLNTANEQVVTFTVRSGPGRVLGAHNGDQRDHTPNFSPSCVAAHGLVRGVVQVTEYYAGSLSERQQLTEIDVDSGRVTKIITTDAQPLPIVVEASSPGLASSTVTINLSTDPRDSVLQTAERSVRF